MASFSPDLHPDEHGVLYGAAYYAEYQPGRDVATDLDLMQAAGFTVIRVGESVWSTWEPRDNEFDVEWLRPVLDGAHERGISVVLGTPTYAIPPWLQVMHPDLAGESGTGVRRPWGGRQEMDYTSEKFRFYAERVIRAVLRTYADHPAVVGFQVDNEPGMILVHNEAAFAGFVARLKAKYGSVDALNAAWGLTYWSHRLTSFAELWRPDGNTFPQYDLAWRAYQADLTSEFIHWQAGIVREYSTESQWVTTCIAYPRPAQDDFSMVAELDIVAGNPYYDMQDGLDLVARVTEPADFAVTGVGKFFRQADRMWSGRQERFLVTETNAQSIGAHSYNLPPYPGQLKQAAYGFVSRGAKMVEYWHWQTLSTGFETYWGGVLPHSGKPGRVFDEVSGIGRSLREVGPSLAGYIPDSDIALVYSNASKWAFEFSSPLPGADGHPDQQSYDRIFDAFHTGIVESDRQAVIFHEKQLVEQDAAQFAIAHPVLVVPALYIASDGILAWLREYAGHGHLIIGIRTGYADLEAAARVEVAPPGLSAVAGMHYEEFSNLRADLRITGHAGFAVSGGAAATGWLDGIIAGEATVLATVDHRELGRFPAITTRETAGGRVTYVGTVPNAELSADIAAWAVDSPKSAGWTSEPAGRVTVQSGVSASGRLRFVFNWSGEDVTLTVPVSCFDLESGESVAAGQTVRLGARDTRIFRDN